MSADPCVELPAANAQDASGSWPLPDWHIVLMCLFLYQSHSSVPSGRVKLNTLKDAALMHTGVRVHVFLNVVLLRKNCLVRGVETKLSSKWL